MVCWSVIPIIPIIGGDLQIIQVDSHKVVHELHDEDTTQSGLPCTSLHFLDDELNSHRLLATCE